MSSTVIESGLTPAEARARRLLALPAVLVGMGSVQIGASLAKLLFPVLGAIETACARVVLAAIVLLLLARPWRRGVRLFPGRTAAITIVAYGLSLAVMNTVFYAALSRLPLGITVAIEFMGPLALALAGSRRALDLLWVALAVGGLLILLQPWQFVGGHAGHPLDPVGILLALTAGVTWALYILVGRRLGGQVEGNTATALGMAIAALAVLPFGWSVVPNLAIHPALLASAFGMAMLSSAVPYSIEMMAMRRMSTRGFSIMMSLEPAIAAVAGLLLLGEHLSPMRWLAIGGIVVASLGSAAAGDALPPPAPPPD
ncbi:EamA family transporter [Lichenicola sp.]|uniref:EamA family transporter n=1 Tax=Lichenicola sp. TaxID=2804529 RepID=UPI003AFFADD6